MYIYYVLYLLGYRSSIYHTTYIVKISKLGVANYMTSFNQFESPYEEDPESSEEESENDESLNENSETEDINWEDVMIWIV